MPKISAMPAKMEKTYPVETSREPISDVIVRSRPHHKACKPSVTAEANKSQPNEKYDDLHKTDNGTAVPAEEIGFGSHGENEKPNKGNTNTDSCPWCDRVVRARGGFNRGGCGEGLVIGHGFMEEHKKDLWQVTF
jgi:hypothetical protein